MDFLAERHFVCISALTNLDSLIKLSGIREVGQFPASGRVVESGQFPLGSVASFADDTDPLPE